MLDIIIDENGSEDDCGITNEKKIIENSSKKLYLLHSETHHDLLEKN